MNALTTWLAAKLDTFDLRVKAGKRKEGYDTYYCAGWADGYKAAQSDARAAHATDLVYGPDEEINS